MQDWPDLLPLRLLCVTLMDLAVLLLMRLSTAILFTVLLYSHVIGQSSLKILSPEPNEEVCLGASLPIAATIANRDSITRTIVALFEIRHIAFDSVLYSHRDTLYDMPSGSSTDTSFPDYITSITNPNQLGTFRACVFISALDAASNPIPDWPLTDSSCRQLFGIRITDLPYNDPMNDYTTTVNDNIPDYRKWLSFGASVVEGNDFTWDPPPPRKEPDDTIVYGKSNLRSPVVRLDRLDRQGKLYTGIGTGDTITSFPFNLTTSQRRFVLSFDYMRAGKQRYPLLWNEKSLLGPEHLVVNPQNYPLREGDSLIVEFKDTGTSTCNPEKWDRMIGIGGGQDFDFKSFHLPIYESKYCDSAFRYRIILKTNNNAESIGPADDDDPWYLDNITLQPLGYNSEIEVMWVRVVTPYTKLPSGSTTALPVYIKFKSTTRSVAVAFPLQVVILNDNRDTVYKTIRTITSLQGGRDSVIRLQDWNAQNTLGVSSKYFVYGKLSQNGYDDYRDNNTTHSIFYLNVEQDTNAVQEFALDDGSNDIPELTGIGDGGIGFDGTSGSYAVKFTLPRDDTLFGTRIYFARHNSATDYIRITVLRGDAGCIPGDTITSFVDMRRPPMNEFYPYYFPKPEALQAGTYWLSVSQLSIDNYMIGGDISRGGAQIIVADTLSPKFAPIYSSPYGTQTTPWENTGDIRCMYAVEVPAGSGQWSPWMPNAGFWPVHSASSIPMAIKLNPMLSSPFIGAGTYLPMIRPMVGSFNRQPAHANHSIDPFTFDAYPNPFTPGSTDAHFSITLPESSLVSAVLYDDLGRAIRTLADRMFEQGEHTLRWDGKDSDGAFVLNGVYTCQLKSNDRSVSVRLLVIR